MARRCRTAPARARRARAARQAGPGGAGARGLSCQARRNSWPGALSRAFPSEPPVSDVLSVKVSAMSWPRLVAASGDEPRGDAVDLVASGRHTHVVPAGRDRLVDLRRRHGRARPPRERPEDARACCGARRPTPARSARSLRPHRAQRRPRLGCSRDRARGDRVLLLDRRARVARSLNERRRPLARPGVLALVASPSPSRRASGTGARAASDHPVGSCASVHPSPYEPSHVYLCWPPPDRPTRPRAKAPHRLSLVGDRIAQRDLDDRDFGASDRVDALEVGRIRDQLLDLLGVLAKTDARSYPPVLRAESS